jgi:hypothetical protein
MNLLDICMVAGANLANLLVIGVFLGKLLRRKAFERGMGLGLIAVGAGLLVGAAFNLAGQRGWWLAALPLPFVLFCVVDYVLDYRLNSNFRATAWAIPYLVLFYAGLIGLVGYAFAVAKPAGFVTLATYFGALSISLVTYRRVGHGI